MCVLNMAEDRRDNRELQLLTAWSLSRTCQPGYLLLKTEDDYAESVRIGNAKCTISGNCWHGSLGEDL